jgi:hypothetical protein
MALPDARPEIASQIPGIGRLSLRETRAAKFPPTTGRQLKLRGPDKGHRSQARPIVFIGLSHYRLRPERKGAQV